MATVFKRICKLLNQTKDHNENKKKHFLFFFCRTSYLLESSKCIASCILNIRGRVNKDQASLTFPVEIHLFFYDVIALYCDALNV